MFRSAPLGTVLSRTSIISTLPVARRSLRPFAAPRWRPASTSSTSTRFRTTSYPVLLGALTCALLGYAIGSATSLSSPLASLGFRSQKVSMDDEPTYGSPEDFQKAIQELRRTFDEGHESGIVSTDPENLRVHGASDSDQHPGAYRSLMLLPPPSAYFQISGW